MPLYIVTTTATAMIRERWAMQAASFDEARERVEEADRVAFMSESVIEDSECDREYSGAELAGTREADVRDALEAAGNEIEDED